MTTSRGHVTLVPTSLVCGTDQRYSPYVRQVEHNIVDQKTSIVNRPTPSREEKDRTTLEI